MGNPTRPSRAGIRLLACSSLLLCSGCFDLLQEIWLEPGGGGRLKLEVTLPRSLLSMSRLGGEDILASAREDAASAKAELASDPDIRRFDFRSEEAPGVVKLIYEVESDDASKLPAAQERALAALARQVQRSQPGASRLPVTFQVRRRYWLGFELQGTVAAGREGEGRDAGDELGKAVAGAMLGGHAITVRLHAPSIISSNGTPDATRSAVEWKVPLSALVEPGFRQELSAVALVVDWRIGAAGAALALLFIGFLYGRLTARRR